ncbi:MAG: magnesium chelatase domain-containing protein, partial [Litorimonas sp.]
GKDVYLNVAGGLRINEPAADLAVAAAIASSAFDVALPSDMVVFGEISLSGEVRPVSRSDARLKESAKLGFERAIAAPLKKRATNSHLQRNDNAALPIIPIRSLRDLVRRVEAAVERGPDTPESWAA